MKYRFQNADKLAEGIAILAEELGIEALFAGSGDITVTVTQPQVSAGSHCTVELIVNRFWENSGDRNITATDITRSTLYY